MARKKASTQDLVTVRILEPLYRDGQIWPAGTEMDVPVRRARIWLEGQLCELVDGLPVVATPEADAGDDDVDAEASLDEPDEGEATE